MTREQHTGPYVSCYYIWKWILKISIPNSKCSRTRWFQISPAYIDKKTAHSVLSCLHHMKLEVCHYLWSTIRWAGLTKVTGYKLCQNNSYTIYEPGAHMSIHTNQEYPKVSDHKLCQGKYLVLYINMILWGSLFMPTSDTSIIWVYSITELDQSTTLLRTVHGY